MSMVLFMDKLQELDKPALMLLHLKAVSKERPRTGNSGHFYTPPRTQKFEQYVAECATTLRRSPYTCPVEVNIVICDPVPKSFDSIKRGAAHDGFITPQVGDLDNKVKAITDALNGILYLDDKQISKMSAIRYYASEHTIKIQVKRSGLSLGELDLYKKYGNGAINHLKGGA